MVAIILFGNIAAGKTTIAQALQEEVGVFDYFCLDQYRLDHYMDPNVRNDSFRQNEANLQEKMLRDLLSSDQVIYETLGTSLFSQEVLNKIREKFEYIYTIFIDCPANECIKRYAERTIINHLAKPPYAGKTKDYIYRLQMVLPRQMNYDLRINTLRMQVEKAVSKIIEIIDPSLLKATMKEN